MATLNRLRGEVDQALLLSLFQISSNLNIKDAESIEELGHILKEYVVSCSDENVFRSLCSDGSCNEKMGFEFARVIVSAIQRNLISVEISVKNVNGSKKYLDTSEKNRVFKNPNSPITAERYLVTAIVGLEIEGLGRIYNILDDVFCSMDVFLTPKGYETALALQEHRDTKNILDQQRKINNRLVIVTIVLALIGVADLLLYDGLQEKFSNAVLSASLFIITVLIYPFFLWLKS